MTRDVSRIRIGHVSPGHPLPSDLPTRMRGGCGKRTAKAVTGGETDAERSNWQGNDQTCLS